MQISIAPRAGVWCRSLKGWDQFRNALASGDEPDVRLPEPLPELLPPREGRRAPLHVRLALEAGVQACVENSLGPGEVATVFASSMGDTQITDYMCRALAGPDKVLSPTRFHNSVHNAASGYWSIAAGNRKSSTAVAAQEFTLSAALLEAAVMASCEQQTVLLTACDIAAVAPLDAVCANRQPFAVGLLMAPGPGPAGWKPFRVEFRNEAANWPEPSAAWLRTLAEENPCARAMPILEALLSARAAVIELPLSPSASLRLASAS